jgi:hypothetical protein
MGFQRSETDQWIEAKIEPSLIGRRLDLMIGNILPLELGVMVRHHSPLDRDVSPDGEPKHTDLFVQVEPI